MAILKNLWVNNTRKRLAGAVLYKSKGQQIARELAGNVANPRTRQQMTQRIRLANLVAMYRANKSWMDKYAFENKKQTWSVYNAFVSANISGSQVALTKSEAAAGACVVAPYKMTDGSLPQVQINELAQAGVYATDLYVGDLEISSSTTIGDLSAALIANNNGLVNGMQLSLIENEQEVINNIPRVVVRAYEFIINSADTTLLSEKWGSAGLTTYTGGSINAIAYSTMQGASAFTFVLSHTFGGKTHVGASYMVLNDPAVYESYITSTAVDLAIQSYGSGNSTPFLDSTEAGGASEGGSNPDVPTTPSILNVATIKADLTPNAAVNPGSYIGGFVREANVGLRIGMSTLTGVTPTGVTVYAMDSSTQVDGYTSSLTTDGNYITARWVEVPFNPGAAISKVVVNTSDGNIEATFSTTDTGVTE